MFITKQVILLVAQPKRTYQGKLSMILVSCSLNHNLTLKLVFLFQNCIFFGKISMSYRKLGRALMMIPSRKKLYLNFIGFLYQTWDCKTRKKNYIKFYIVNFKQAILKKILVILSRAIWFHRDLVTILDF